MPEAENISLIGQAKARPKLTDRGASIDLTTFLLYMLPYMLPFESLCTTDVANMPPDALSELVGVGCYRKISYPGISQSVTYQSPFQHIIDKQANILDNSSHLNSPE